MSIWQVEVHETTIWSSTCWQYVSRKIDKLFHGLHNVCGIDNAILMTGFDDLSRVHDETVGKVLQICRKANLKLNKEKCHFRCSSIPFFGEIISWDGSNSDSRKLKVPIVMPPSKYKKGIQSFLNTISYLSKFSPAIAPVCEPLRKLMSVKSE